MNGNGERGPLQRQLPSAHASSHSARHSNSQSFHQSVIPAVGRLVNRTMLPSNESTKKDTICKILSYAVQLTEFMSGAKSETEPDSDDDDDDPEDD